MKYLAAALIFCYVLLGFVARQVALVHGDSDALNREFLATMAGATWPAQLVVRGSMRVFSGPPPCHPLEKQP